MGCVHRLSVPPPLASAKRPWWRGRATIGYHLLVRWIVGAVCWAALGCGRHGFDADAGPDGATRFDADRDGAASPDAAIDTCDEVVSMTLPGVDVISSARLAAAQRGPNQLWVALDNDRASQALGYEVWVLTREAGTWQGLGGARFQAAGGSEVALAIFSAPAGANAALSAVWRPNAGTNITTLYWHRADGGAGDAHVFAANDFDLETGAATTTTTGAAVAAVSAGGVELVAAGSDGADNAPVQQLVQSSVAGPISVASGLGGLLVSYTDFINPFTECFLQRTTEMGSPVSAPLQVVRDDTGAACGGLLAAATSTDAVALWGQPDRLSVQRLVLNGAELMRDFTPADTLSGAVAEATAAPVAGGYVIATRRGTGASTTVRLDFLATSESLVRVGGSIPAPEAVTARLLAGSPPRLLVATPSAAGLDLSLRTVCAP